MAERVPTFDRSKYRVEVRRTGRWSYEVYLVRGELFLDLQVGTTITRFGADRLAERTYRLHVQPPQPVEVVRVIASPDAGVTNV